MLNKLRKEKEKEFEALDFDPIIQEAQLLLNAAEEQDLTTLKVLGLDHFVKFEETLTQDRNGVKRYEDIYKQEAFTGKQIKQLCNNYYLRLVPIDKYQGKFPASLAREIREFCQKNDITISRSSFYILAARETIALHTEKRPVSRDLDPIVFYRQTDGASRGTEVSEREVLVQVTHWGKDFSVFRSLMPMFSWERKTEDDISPLGVFIICSLVVLAFLLLSIFNDSLAPVVIGSIFAFGLYAITGSFASYHEYDLWNKSHKTY